MSTCIRVPSIRQDYNYQWRKKGDIAELIGALAIRMRQTPEVIIEEGIDIELLFFSLLTIYRDWFDESHQEDLELQALLAVAASCNWLYSSQPDKLTDLLEMLEEVRHYDKQTRDFTTQFTREGLHRAVENSLGAVVHSCVLEPDMIEVTFTQGNYGEGEFDGILCLDEYEGLFIINHTLKDRQYYTGLHIPKNLAELEESLKTDLWGSTRSYGKLNNSEKNFISSKQKDSLTTKSYDHYETDRYNFSKSRQHPPKFQQAASRQKKVHNGRI